MFWRMDRSNLTWLRGPLDDGFQITANHIPIQNDAPGNMVADIGKIVAQGMLHAYTAFATTSDAREFGQSFGTVLATVAPAIKRLPNRTVYRLQGPWLTPEGKASCSPDGTAEACW